MLGPGPTTGHTQMAALPHFPEKDYIIPLKLKPQRFSKLPHTCHFQSKNGPLRILCVLELLFKGYNQLGHPICDGQLKNPIHSPKASLNQAILQKKRRKIIYFSLEQGKAAAWLPFFWENILKCSASLTTKQMWIKKRCWVLSINRTNIKTWMLVSGHCHLGRWGVWTEATQWTDLWSTNSASFNLS